MTVPVSRWMPWVLFLPLAIATLAAAAERELASPVDLGLPLVFDSEVIRLSVVDDTLEVHGTYVFRLRKRPERPFPLFYPFPRDSLMGGARMVSLRVHDGDGEAVPASWEERARASGVRWWIPACRSDSLTVESVYRQGLLSGHARYIVTTTQAWGRPLRRARFEIRLPRGVEPTAFSFPFTRRYDEGGVVYVYEATVFLPDQDIVVRWGESGSIE